MTEPKKKDDGKVDPSKIPDTDKVKTGVPAGSPPAGDKAKPPAPVSGQVEMTGKAFAQSALGKAGKKALGKRDVLVKAEEEYGSALMDMMIAMKRNGKKTCKVEDSKGISFTFLYGVTASREKVTIKETK